MNSVVLSWSEATRMMFSSYADVVHKQPSFVITPQTSQYAAVTKNAMIKNVNPVSSNVNRTKVANVQR